MGMINSIRLGSLASFVAVTIFSTSALAQQPKKPNIVFILADNLGYGELGVYGGGILRGAATPRIDTLASEGTRLLNFNVEAQCTPFPVGTHDGSLLHPLRYIRSPIGGVPDGLTLWEITIARLLSGQGYATGMWGKWHLGSAEDRFPTNQGSMSGMASRAPTTRRCGRHLNETKSMWPSVGNKQGWNAKVVQPEPIYEARKGEKPRKCRRARRG